MKNFIYLFLFISFLSVSFSNENTIIFAQGEGYSKYKIFHQEEISNYNVEISLSPINPVVGQQIFSIYISDLNSKEPLENLIVNVYATPLFDDKKIDEIFDCSYGHPPILKSYLAGNTSLETLVICDRILEYRKDWDKKLDDPVWETVSRKIKKYTPFLNIDVPRYKKILKESVL